MKNVKKYQVLTSKLVNIPLDKVTVIVPRQHGTTHSILRMAYERSNDNNKILIVGMSMDYAKMYQDQYINMHNIVCGDANVTFSSRRKFTDIMNQFDEIYVLEAAYGSYILDVGTLSKFKGRVVLATSVETTYNTIIPTYINATNDDDNKIHEFHKLCKFYGFSVFETVNQEENK